MRIVSHLLEMVKWNYFYFICKVLYLEEIGGYFGNNSLMISRIRIFLPQHNLIFLLLLEIRIDSVLCPELGFQLAMWQLKQKKCHILHSICSAALKHINKLRVLNSHVCFSMASKGYSLMYYGGEIMEEGRYTIP